MTIHNSQSALPKDFFTSCPNCLQQFRIRAGQLSAASGQVQCGMCDRQFNAVSRLSDTPLSAEQITERFGGRRKPISATALSKQQSTDTPGNDISDRSQASMPDEILDDLPEYDELPNELHEYLPENKKPATRLIWTLGTFLLLVTITGQWAWFNRDLIFERYPNLEPVAEKICKQFKCELLKYKDIKMIKLLNRVVRNHPKHQNNLLVNATMINHAVKTQAFPLVQLALFDKDGEIVAYGEFEPEQYLYENASRSAGMLPGSLTYFELEINGATEDAIGFEFKFL